MTTTALIPSPSPGLLPARLFAPTPKAARRVVDFFTAQVNSDHTRKAYLNAARRFAEWCEAHGLDESSRRSSPSTSQRSSRSYRGSSPSRR